VNGRVLALGSNFSSASNLSLRRVTADARRRSARGRAADAQFVVQRHRDREKIEIDFVHRCVPRIRKSNKSYSQSRLVLARPIANDLATGTNIQAEVARNNKKVSEGIRSDASSFSCGGNLETKEVVCSDLQTKFKHENGSELDYENTGVGKGMCKSLPP
jgi:hypothetical protein